MRSLHNVGSIFRTADVFAVTTLFLTGYTGHPPNPKLEKVALGADRTVPWEYSKSPVRLIKKLRARQPKISVVGLENNLFNTPPSLPYTRGGTSKLAVSDVNHRGSQLLSSMPTFKPHFPLLLILGEEVGGIPKNLLKVCDEFLEIPQFGTKESLNVSVAFGIAAYMLAIKGRLF